MNCKPADISPRILGEIERLQNQIQHDTGRSILLVAYEREVPPTPVFGDIQREGPEALKDNVFQGPDDLYGNITQWHV